MCLITIPAPGVRQVEAQDQASKIVLDPILPEAA